ncbi:16S rRNA (cytidine(1402)-2'-O)-methyltransferase [Entomospira culicis]|uniref:Ribosomal RNA small subunit methyltransferase I n=1 Tax=Entomospira culicis TaxID=2719989 RepID=A0A968GGL8_9SPIO|nr:16S rRNA (cytidine(1402)-2'-O)-methyltransferase [Entomospira culicis]NIZ18423.1 16S rRNA (cytidine(1402)-2'-O)-methyltransferase [Entomospira culicis]NIZ68639.1 16S rRNA (cytidine(1402)-2'-O)-methyltransferase [Entomospira culicis]WDI37239.1 16S rRNA (cytidine(1402)-2'-O)-methyltransferase [Entomospira culicis]WDI38867.1 16S rRNA (cytidine(1402)-2'-O)-methyltransferase [Entomospira culicis]
MSNPDAWGTLYIVATPIGNLEDLTFRALRILKEVSYIGCEDTRKTSKLLHHYDISQKRLLACHRHNERASAQGIIKLLEAGHDVAYCSDSGTPGISDPGARLVESVLLAGGQVHPIPGVSALATLFSVMGTNDETLLFAGFLPQRGQKRTKRLQELLTMQSAILLYESPYRAENLLKELAELAPDRHLIVGREMTKLYEEFWRGSAQSLAHERIGTPFIGEFALIITYNHKC